MQEPIRIETDRLVLRQWCKADLEPFFQLNSDPTVMECFPNILSRQESDLLAERFQTKIEEKGWGFWAVSVPTVSDFIGFIGLNSIDDSEFPFAPAVEIGWRLARPYWGFGYATEGAQGALACAFEMLKLEEVVSFTAVSNDRSQAVMRRLAMRCNPQEQFNHPKLAPKHPLSCHVLYRITRAQWSEKHTL